MRRKWINEKGLHYYGVPFSAVVARGKLQLVLCFTIYRKVASVSRWRL